MKAITPDVTKWAAGPSPSYSEPQPTAPMSTSPTEASIRVPSDGATSQDNTGNGSEGKEPPSEVFTSHSTSAGIGPVSTSKKSALVNHIPWRLNKVHEWLLPSEISQSTIDGRSGSNACVVIGAEDARRILLHKMSLPKGSVQPSSHMVGEYVEAIRVGCQAHC